MKKLTIFVEDLPNNTNIATQVGYNAKKLGQYLTNDQLTTRPIPIPEEHTCSNCGNDCHCHDTGYQYLPMPKQNMYLDSMGNDIPGPSEEDEYELINARTHNSITILDNGNRVRIPQNTELSFEELAELVSIMNQK